MWSILYYLRNNPEVIKKSQIKRGLDPSIVDKALEYDRLWRQKLKELETLRHQRNIITREIAKTMDSSQRRKLINQARELTRTIRSLEKEVEFYERERNKILLSIPNIVHPSTPVGEDEEDNMPIAVYGKPRVWRGHLDSFLEQIAGFDVDYEILEWRPKSHYELGYLLKHIDTERAAKVSGSRFYYLFEDLVWLDIALTLYAIDFLTKKGYTLVEPPFMMRRKAYEGVVSLEDFRDSIYEVAGEDLLLIATSEHPMAALFMNEVLEEGDLPIKLVGVSPCFRKEAGAHGKDTKGIFRVHQFNKVEQFIFSLPEDSWRLHEELLQNAIEIWRALDLPFRVVDVCTGDLGAVPARKYDLETWMPGQGRFREVVSCSNCTDYQSYRLNIRYSEKIGYPSKGYVHTLNSTAIATSRAITAILENFQQEDGTILIPKVLRRYLENFENAPKEIIEPLKMRWLR
ncbi:MAG: serine--tRNA ligase [Thermoprotei archaeon]|nr:MAG: serine--tRNA ligase [Thermoprotei archaeon]